MKKILYIFCLVLLLVGGCVTERPMVRVEKGASLTGYDVFEVTPVSNETGRTYDFEVTDVITQYIKSSLQEKGFTVAEITNAKKNVIILKSSLISYEPGSAFNRWLLPGYGKTQCTVKTSLIDRKTGKILGEMVAAEAVGGGGLYSIGADKWILNVVAKSISDEIDRKVKGKTVCTYTVKDVRINIDYKPSAPTRVSSGSTTPLKVKLLNFKDKQDKRSEPTLIGRRYAAFRVPMGVVQSFQPVSELISDAIKSELSIQGYSIVTENEDIVISGEILKFWVGTEATLLYWDVVGEVSLALEIKQPKSGITIPLGPYSSKKVERTYLNPCEEILQRVLEASLTNVMRSVSLITELNGVFTGELPKQQ